MPPAGPVIALEGVVKVYGPVRALDGLDLEVQAGDLFGFLGPNGSGKTTTIRILTGFLRPTSGTARVFGLDPWRDSVAVKRHLGFLPDIGELYEGLDGGEVLDYLGGLTGRPTGAERRRLCDRLELGRAALDRKVRGYSRGMKQKLGIVQALQHDPELIIMDEPTEGLDPLMQQTLFDLLRERQRQGRTVFISSHKLPEVEQLCRRAGIIRDGRLVAVDEVRELRQRALRRLEVAFRGKPPADLPVPGVEVISTDGGVWALAVRGDINPILRELARYDLADLVLEPAHLEDVFMTYYQRPQNPGNQES